MIRRPDTAIFVASDFDPALLDFIRNRVNSFLKWDLVRLFFEQPHAVNTAGTIAQQTGRDLHTVELALAALADSGIVQMSSAGGITVFMLSTDEATRNLIGRFLLACQDRAFRVKAIYHLIGARSHV